MWCGRVSQEPARTLTVSIVLADMYKLFKSISSAAGVLIAISASPAYATVNGAGAATNQVKRPIEELFKTDMVYPQEKGELQVGLASLYQHNSSGDAWTVPVSLEYGLTDRWQVEAEWKSFVQHNYANHSTVRGISDLEIGTQYSFMNIGDSLFHIAPRFSIEIPLGDVNKGLTEGFMEYQPAIILARDFPQFHHAQLFAEIGISFVQRVKRPSEADDAEPAAHGLNLGIGGFVPFSRGALTMEFNWANNQWNHHGTGNELYLTPGWIWKVTRNFEIGMGIPVGLNNRSDQYDVIVHVVCEF